MRSNKFKISLATLAATVGLLAFFVPAASAWHGEFHGSATNDEGGRLSFSIVAEPGRPVAIMHFHYRGGSCGSVEPGNLTLRDGAGTLHAAHGSGLFENSSHSRRLSLVVDLTRHGDHVSAHGHFEAEGWRCANSRTKFTATATPAGLP